MLTSIFHAGSFNAQNVIIALAFSLALGIVIALVYKLCSTTVNGFATGMGFLSLSLMITGGAAIWILLLEKTGFGRQASREKQLRITIPEDLEYEGIFDDLLTGYARKWSLESVRTTNMGTMYELSYRLETDPHSNKNDKELLDALRCRNGNLTIVMGNAQRERNEF